MSKILDELESSIQAKIDGDVSFQSTLNGLSDEDRTAKIEEQKEIERDLALASLKEKADKATKAEEVANNYKTRAEKAETALKAKGDAGTPKTPENEIGYREAMALTRANVADEDVDTVIRWAKFNGVPVTEALKDPVMQTTLKTREEQRKTAAATNTGPAKRGSAKLSDEEIVERAERGELPEDPSVLVKAQLNLKRKKK